VPKFIVRLDVGGRRQKSQVRYAVLEVPDRLHKIEAHDQLDRSAERLRQKLHAAGTAGASLPAIQAG
jgi:hypothetical protein